MERRDTLDAASATPQRFIIDRPRLMTALDQADAPILLCVAPAGYGKTTLVRQWVSAAGKPVCWLKTRPSHADIAALAVDLARHLDALTPGVSDEVQRHLRTVDDPSHHAEPLAHTVVASLVKMPADAWLVIDDYDYIASSEAADRFTQVVIENAARVVITARRRPAWASARRALYGELCLLDERALAFTEYEAAALLGTTAERAREIWTVTKGWPAVIRLAALARGVRTPPDALPPELHQYFAEELYQAASKSVRSGLTRLAALPTLHPPLVTLALGKDEDTICREATALGFLSAATVSHLELHPLLRSFLQTKLGDDDKPYLLEVVTEALRLKQWDDAFSMIEQFSLSSCLPELFEGALEPLLAEHRIATLERWVEVSVANRCVFPLLHLAEAEIARRTGRFELGESSALQAALAFERVSSQRTSRAYALAGECAHHDYRHVDAIRHHRLAERHATSEPDALRALWGHFVSATQVEDPLAHDLLNKLEAIADASPSTRLRIACGRLMLSSLSGGIETVLRRQRRQISLIDKTDDPLVKTSFLYRLAFANVAVGNYSDALRLATTADSEARRARLPFAVIHLTAAAAAATLGQRQLKRAQMHVDRLAASAKDLADAFESANALALRARIHLARNQSAEAARLLVAWEDAPTASIRGECAALRAIALAVMDVADEADSLADLTLRTTSEYQPVTLACAAKAIIALSRSSDQAARLDAVERVLIERQDYDDFVCAYRAYPELLAAVRQRGAIPERRLEVLIQNARDTRLAASLGWDVRHAKQMAGGLSRRETEVYDLLCKGLTNREIAEQLVIAEVTVKVHVRHILEKLGVRSRTEAAMWLYETA